MPKLKIEPTGISQKQNLNNLVDIIFKMVRDPKWEADSLNHYSDVRDEPMCILAHYVDKYLPNLVNAKSVYQRALHVTCAEMSVYYLGDEFVLEGDGLLKLMSVFGGNYKKNLTLVHRLQIACELAGLTK